MGEMIEISDVYQLASGSVIEDPVLSARMQMIVERQPERSSRLSATGYSWDEVGMSQLFAEVYRDSLKYCGEKRSWYVYADGAWRIDTNGLEIAGAIKEFYRLMSLYLGEIADDDRREAFTKLLAKMGDRRFRDRIAKDAADNDLLKISASDFDADPYLINCRNGTYDLRTMTFREHDWRDYLTMQTAFDFTLQDVSYPRWEEFISEVTSGEKDKADYLQKSLGYSLLGIAREECMFILHGRTTRNGKSTLLSAIEHMLGDYATVAQVQIICKSDRFRDENAATPALSSLRGSRFVTMAESNQYGKLDEEMIKQLTGGEAIKTRALYEKTITWTPQFTLWLSCNDLPSVSDRSLFASDRIRVIEFNRHFKADEQDKNLKTEFQEPEAMQGIFAWLLKGYFRYQRSGLRMPKRLQKVVDDYERDNDLVLQFLEARCEKEDKAYTRKTMLFDAYKLWCKSNGYYFGTAKRFHAEMDAHPEWHGGTTTRDGYKGYKDLRLK